MHGGFSVTVRAENVCTGVSEEVTKTVSSKVNNNNNNFIIFERNNMRSCSANEEDEGYIFRCNARKI